MHTPELLLLKAIGESLVNTLAGELEHDSLIVDALPQVAKGAWTWWSKEREKRDRRIDVRTLIKTPAETIRQAVAEIVPAVAGGHPAEFRQALARYLEQVPATMRHELRRPGDPSGMTLPAHVAVGEAEDLFAFLPIRLPRYQPGDRPLPGVDWEVVELLGMGGIGEVWKAHNPNQPDFPPVVLKFCLDPWAARVLRAEAKLLDQLMIQGRHAGIVPLRQTYLNMEFPCLEYEYVAAGDVACLVHEWQRSRRPWSHAQVSEFILQVARVIGFAHRLDPPIVHRDLKPSNILVQHERPDVTDGGPQDHFIPRITDFGNGLVAATHEIRRALRGTTQALQQIYAQRGALTPLYAPPQQMRGQEANPRDDVYALGIIWYQLLTSDLKASRPGGPRLTKRLTELGMPLPLVLLLGTCISDNPDDRPRDGEALADQLAHLLQAGQEPAADIVTSEATELEERQKQGVDTPRSLARRLTNSIDLAMVLIPAGTFRMGSPSSESERGKDEGPQHEVTITRPFYMGIYPVTQRQYEAVIGHNPSYFNNWKGGSPDHPVENVSWEDAVEFCRRLSARAAERETGRVYRLPTEAEWEYACRGGMPMPFSSGVTLTSHEANFNGNYPYGPVPRGPYLERTTRVGSYLPNPYGLYDMHGNVWEWCSDYYDANYYRNSPRYDPSGPPAGHLRVVRGGSCYNIGRFCRATYRFGVAPGNRDLDVGLRVVMVPEER
jgi:formylglycine-generating enzyme required for sulfatase activity